MLSEESLKEEVLTVVEEINKGLDVLRSPQRAISSRTCRTAEKWGHNSKDACHPCKGSSEEGMLGLKCVE